MRSNESGAVVSYVIGAVLLVMAVIGGVYFAHYRGDTGTQAEVPNVSDKKDDTNKSNQSGKDEKSGSSKEADKNTAEEKKAEDAAREKIAAEKQKKADAEAKAEELKSEPSSQTEKQEQPEASTPMDRREVAAAGALPTTGPADLLATVVGIIAILGSGYVYYHFGRK